MKKVIVSAIMLTAMATAMYAQKTNVTSAAGATSAAVVADDDSKVKIDVASLPDAIKNVLAGDNYKAWQATDAWLVKGNPEYYTVQLKKEDKVMTLNLDKDGTVRKA